MFQNTPILKGDLLLLWKNINCKLSDAHRDMQKAVLS